MSKYRKITFKELQEIAARMKFWDEIPVDKICSEARTFWDNPSYIQINWEDEYNDSGYNLRPSSIVAYDENKNVVNTKFDDKDWKHPLHSAYSNWIYNLEIGSESFNGDRELKDIWINVKEEKIVSDKDEIELYVLEK